jgi:hypothetical protein
VKVSLKFPSYVSDARFLVSELVESSDRQVKGMRTVTTHAFVRDDHRDLFSVASDPNFLPTILSICIEATILDKEWVSDEDD